MLQSKGMGRRVDGVAGVKEVKRVKKG